MIKAELHTILLYVRDVDALKHFYQNLFDFKVIEEYPSEWALLQIGACHLGLHRIGAQYRADIAEDYQFDNNTKLIFSIDEDIHTVRDQLIQQHVAMQQVKTFENYAYWLCDGKDPEGNVFQIKQKKVE